MKLSRADAVNLNNLLATVALGGVDSIVIDNGFASGLNQKNCAFISDVSIPIISQKLGLSRLNLLRQRLDLLINNPDVVIDAKESDRGEISQLEISAGKTKIQFRCTSTALIKAPKKLNDDPVLILTMSKDELQLLLSSVRVMSAKQFTMIVKKDRTSSFEISDATNDKMTIGLCTHAELVSEDDLDTVVHYYNTDIVAALFRAGSTDDGISFSVGGAGTINLLVNGHPMYIFSQIDTE